jgi:hypothetical protein
MVAAVNLGSVARFHCNPNSGWIGDSLPPPFDDSGQSNEYRYWAWPGHALHWTGLENDRTVLTPLPVSPNGPWCQREFDRYPFPRSETASPRRPALQIANNRPPDSGRCFIIESGFFAAVTSKLPLHTSVSSVTECGLRYL